MGKMLLKDVEKKYNVDHAILLSLWKDIQNAEIKNNKINKYNSKQMVELIMHKIMKAVEEEGKQKS